MRHSNHNSFILTSITKILEEAISATSGIGDGIETYALYDYVMQSVFLKMTGAQEQKMKCICWELATNDYEFRKDFLIGNDKLSVKGMSHYDDKQKVYIELIKQIEKNNPKMNIEEILDKKKIRKDIRYYLKKIFENTNFAIWGRKGYDQIFSFFEKSVTVKHFGDDNNLFTKFSKKENEDIAECLQERYEQLYHHRNRCAHNTLSYQQNLPTLDTLRKEEYVYENYFIYFSILILIDEIMMKLYQKYLEVIDYN